MISKAISITLELLERFHILLIWGAIFVLFWFAITSIQRAVDATPNASELDDKKLEARVPNLRVDDELIEEIDSLIEVPEVTLSPKPVGNDPFNP